MDKSTHFFGQPDYGYLIEIFDSNAISLFRDILKCVGWNPEIGRKKRGINVHTVINVDQTMPKMTLITEAAINDHLLFEKQKSDANTISVFDKGYNDYRAFKLFRDTHTDFGTRTKAWSF